jgi:dATP pyrophosphohydrolase
MAVPRPVAVTLDPVEHLGYKWLPWREAAAITISWSNRDAILALPRRTGVSVK